MEGAFDTGDRDGEAVLQMWGQSADLVLTGSNENKEEKYCCEKGMSKFKGRVFSKS